MKFVALTLLLSACGGAPAFVDAQGVDAGSDRNTCYDAPARDTSSVDCAAYPWCGNDFCDQDADVPLECWPLADGVIYQPYGRPPSPLQQ